jgi:hypothetical protein
MPLASGDAMNMVWSIWAVAFVLAIARGHERTITLAGLPWWHRILGGIAAVAFCAGYLGRLIGHQ